MPAEKEAKLLEEKRKKPVSEVAKTVQKEEWLPEHPIETLLGVLFRPEKTLSRELPKASLEKGLGLLAVFAGAVGFLIGCFITLALIGAATGEVEALPAFGTLGLIMCLILPIIYIPTVWISTLFINGIHYVLAKLWKGKGSFEEQFYLITLVTIPISIISLAVAWIPIINIYISILVSLYAIYLLTVALKVAHRYSTARAVLTWIIPAVIILLITWYIFTLLPAPVMQKILATYT